MRKVEARAVEALAKALFKILDKAEQEGMVIYEDDKARRALKKLQMEISTWELD